MGPGTSELARVLDSDRCPGAALRRQTQAPPPHVGDLKRTDVAGAQAVGMATVRFRGVVDDPDSGDEADHVIDRLVDLPAVLGLG